MKKKVICSIIVIIILIIFFEVWKNININQKQVAVLVYHNIVQSEEEKEKDPDALLNIEFDEQMKYLKEKGYTAISLDELYEWKEGIKDIPEKSVVITFDDGFYSFKYLAQPILEKYNLKGACFLIGKVTMPKTPDYIEGKYGTIGLDEVQSKSKDIIYGSHTFYLHEQNEKGEPIIKSKSFEELKEDTKKFKNELFDAKYLAYPYYTYTKDYIKVLEEENYKLAFCGEEEMATKKVNNYKVPRISGVRSISEFKEIFESLKYKNKYGNGIVRKILKKVIAICRILKYN